MTVDVHQHLWAPAFVDALRRRATSPRLDGWTLHLEGEPAYEVNPDDHDLARRLTLNEELELALVSLSSPLGIESLPPEDAWPIIDAYHEDALVLPSSFGAWAATCLSDIDPDRLAGALDGGVTRFAGLQLPATALRNARDLARIAPLLDVLTERDLPLFVHPGPASEPEGPAWWPAVVPYVQQLHASWFAFAAFGRTRHPELRVCFSLLAGLAPLHFERLANRGGDNRGTVDPGMFLETSSYGPRAIDAIVRELGIDVVINGSDLPYATAPDPALGDAAWHAIAVTNPSRLLNRKESRK